MRNHFSVVACYCDTTTWSHAFSDAWEQNNMLVKKKDATCEGRTCSQRRAAYLKFHIVPVHGQKTACSVPHTNAISTHSNTLVTNRYITEFWESPVMAHTQICFCTHHSVLDRFGPISLPKHTSCLRREELSEHYHINLSLQDQHKSPPHLSPSNLSHFSN